MTPVNTSNRIGTALPKYLSTYMAVKLEDAAAQFLLKGLSGGALKPVIDRTFKFVTWSKCTVK